MRHQNTLFEIHNYLASCDKMLCGKSLSSTRIARLGSNSVLDFGKT